MARNPRKTTPLRNITEVIQAAQARGSHFFDRDTMRAFNSRLHDPVYITKFGTFFITSEKDRSMTYSDGTYSRGAWDGRRRYTVRFMACRTVRHEYRHYIYTNARGEIISTSHDDFGRFATLNAARKFASSERHRLDALLIKDKPILFTDNPDD